MVFMCSRGIYLEHTSHIDMNEWLTAETQDFIIFFFTEGCCYRTLDSIPHIPWVICRFFSKNVDKEGRKGALELCKQISIRINQNLNLTKAFNINVLHLTFYILKAHLSNFILLISEFLSLSNLCCLCKIKKTINLKNMVFYDGFMTTF